MTLNPVALSKLGFPCQFLSWFEGFAAFQAIQFAPRRNQPAKWAHPLGHELGAWRFLSGHFLCQASHKRKRTADPGKELIKLGRHDFSS
jgi:hypothetical protein